MDFWIAATLTHVSLFALNLEFKGRQAPRVFAPLGSVNRDFNIQ